MWADYHLVKVQANLLGSHLPIQLKRVSETVGLDCVRQSRVGGAVFSPQKRFFTVFNVFQEIEEVKITNVALLLSPVISYKKMTRY